MKYFFTIAFLFFVGIAFAQKSIPKPNPMRLVNDYAKVLNPHDAELLEQKLIALDDSTSNQIVVLTVPSLNGEIIEDVAVNTFREWGIGDQKKNNGILLLIAINDRKVRIEVGYGLEGAIPDVIANNIINNDIKPAFRQQNYLGGITKAVENLSKAAVGEYKVVRKKKGRDGNSGGSILGFVVILVVVFIILGAGGGRGGGRRRGRIDASDLILPMLFSGLGRGGSSGGGGWSGGGGGFGGFGGGSSGGGGASGGW